MTIMSQDEADVSGAWTLSSRWEGGDADDIFLDGGSWRVLRHHEIAR
jgi:hypothetical protein